MLYLGKSHLSQKRAYRLLELCGCKRNQLGELASILQSHGAHPLAVFAKGQHLPELRRNGWEHSYANDQQEDKSSSGDYQEQKDDYPKGCEDQLGVKGSDFFGPSCLD